MITNKWITEFENAQDAVKIREEVFLNEQSVPRDAEFDEHDNVAMHVIVYDDKIPIATGRVWHDGKTFRIGRLAVIKEFRKQGYGDLLIKLLLLKVFEYNPSVVCIVAQEGTLGFYERYGFAKTGDVIMHAEIPHIPMKVTKETLLFKSACGHDKTYADFFPDGK